MYFFWSSLLKILLLTDLKFNYILVIKTSNTSLLDKIKNLIIIIEVILFSEINFFFFIIKIVLHLKHNFRLCGVEMNSQAGYELAIQGPIRPAESKVPLLYGIKCVHFELPHFTIGKAI